MRHNDSQDSTRSFFRTQDRVFLLNGQWFFTTREGEVGPFRSRETALKEVNRYVQERNDLMRFQQARESQQRTADYTLAILPKEDPDLALDDLTLDDLLLESQG